MPKPKQSQPRQPNPGAKSAKITDEKDLYFIGAVLDEVIAEWSDNDNSEELEDLNDFKDQLKEKSKLYVVAEDDDGTLSLRQREKGEPATIVEANFIELTNNQWSKVGVNYKIEGTSATASSADIAPVMQKCTDDEYADNQYSMGKLCAAFNFDKNEEEEKLLTQLHKMESKNPTAPAKGKTKEKKLNKDNDGLNDLDDLNEVVSTEQEKPSNPSKTTIAERIEAARASQPTTAIEDNEDEDFNEPSTPSKTTIEERIKAARANQPTTTGIEDDEDEALDEPSTPSRPTIEEQIKAARASQTTTGIEDDEDEDFNEPSTPSSKVETSRTRQPTTTGIEDDEDDTDFETLDDFDFDSNFFNIIEDIDNVEVHVSEKQQPESTLPSVDSNLDGDTEQKYEGASPARPKAPNKNTLSEISGNREIQNMSQGLTSAGPGLNGFNEIGLASQAALLTIAVAGKAVDCIDYLKEKLAEHNQNKQLKEIIKLAESTQARIEKTSERISTVQKVEASSPTAQTSSVPEVASSRPHTAQTASAPVETPSERSQASSGVETTSAPVEAPSTAAEPPSEQSQSSSPVEATSERSQGQAQAPEQPHTKPIQKPNPTTEVETAGDALAENLGLTASAKLEIDEKASIDEQLKQIKQYLTGLNQKLDKLEERLDIIEEKLGISKIEEKGVSAPATNENNELNGKLINYAKAAKECAEEAGQKPGNLICLPVGNNKLTVDFQAAQTSTSLTSKDNKDLFAASVPEGKDPNVTVCNLTDKEKTMIVRLPQDKDEFKQLISAQAMAKTVVECSSATGKNPFKVRPQNSTECYAFQVETDRETSKKTITGIDTKDDTKIVFLATMQGRNSPVVEESNIPEAVTNGITLKLSDVISNTNTVNQQKSEAAKERKTTVEKREAETAQIEM